MFSSLFKENNGTCWEVPQTTNDQLLRTPRKTFSTRNSSFEYTQEGVQAPKAKWLSHKAMIMISFECIYPGAVGGFQKGGGEISNVVVFKKI